MNNKGIYLWGTGEQAEYIISHFWEELHFIHVEGFIDNDKRKYGETFYGWKIYPPSILVSNSNCDVFISTSYRNEIEEQIKTDLPEFKGNILHERFFEKLGIIKRYRNSDDHEIQEILTFLYNNDLDYFNYSFKEKYNKYVFPIEFDDEFNLYYSIYKGKRVYFARNLDNKTKVEKYIRNLLIEQDDMSPHRYLTDSFHIQQGDVVIDAGAAEGNFSLEIIEKASHIYMFEPDSLWNEALEHTFRPYKNKVSIIKKGLSNYVSNNMTTIDNEFIGKRIDFVKMDIEGEEYYAVEGAHKLFDGCQKIKCIICTYHQEHEYSSIKSYMESLGFSTEHSRGYMWFYERFNDFRPYVLRRALIRAQK